MSLEVVDVTRKVVGDEVGVRDEGRESTESVFFETRCEGRRARVSFGLTIGKEKKYNAPRRSVGGSGGVEEAGVRGDPAGGGGSGLPR